MALVSFRWRRILRNSISTVIGCGCIGAVGTLGLSALLNWDPSGDPATLGGTGTWNYSSPNLWDDNGALPNVPWTDVTGVDTGVFKASGGLVHLGAPVTANGLRFDVTGYTIDNNGIPANTLTLITAVPFGPTPVIANNLANVTSTISANIGGNDGLQFTSGGLTGTTTVLSGDNTFIGGVTINSGTVTLGVGSVAAPGALNQTIRNNLSFGTAASSLRLNGNSTTIRDLVGTTNLSSIVNGRSATNAILTVYQSNDQLVKTVLSDSAGTLELVKAGPATLTLGSDNTYTGATTVRGRPEGGTLELAGNNVGRLTATTSLNVFDGGTLRLTNSSTSNNLNRVPDTAPVNLRGGTFDFNNDGSTASFAETAGAVNLLSGSNTITADQATVGQTSVLTFSALSRSQGTAVNFQSQFQDSNIPGQIGIDNRDRIVFTALPATNGGLLGGWALYDGVDFAAYNTTTVTSVKLATYSLNLVQSSWTTDTNVKIDQSGSISLTDPTFTGTRVVNSLNLATDPISLDLSALTLNVDTGGLISQSSGPFGGSIDNGFLTAGTAALSDLVITVPNAGGTLNVTASIVNNGVGQVNAIGLVKNGPGTLNLTSPNTYSGGTWIVGGTIQIDADNRLGALTGTPTLKLNSGTLSVTNSFTLNAARLMEVGGNSFVSIPAGTTGTGKTLTYNGGISSLAGTEGNLTFLSNAGEFSDVADPGKIVANLTQPLALTGSLRIDATSQAGTSTGIFRANAGFANSVGRSFQLGMNGTALFFQTGNTLSIGAGLDDTFDIGVKDATTFSSVAKVGTFTITGVTQFTAKVDKVRIGVQTQVSESVANNTAGTVTFGTNNDITAGTDITISDNANVAGSTPGATLTASNVTFGAGINNVTSQNILIGGRKGTSTVTVLAGGTLNLKGFGDRLLNLSLGRSDDPDGTGASTGTLNAGNTGSVFTGSFDALVLGQRTSSALLGSATGTLTLSNSASNSVVANSLKLGVDTGYNGSANATATALGMLNQSGGTVTVYNDVALGTQANNGTARGQLNIGGGTFNVGGNITKSNTDRSNGVVTVNGATATLNMRNPLVNDTTSGTITASQFIFRLGTVTNVAAITLDGRDVTSGSVFGPLTDALIVRDVNLPGQINLTGPVANMGGIHYEAAGGGAGATLASISLGSVGRTFNIENSASASGDLTVTGAITGAVPITKSGTGTVLMNGSVAGSVSVVQGALGGTGSVAGTVNVSSAGTLAPAGANIGNFSTGPLTFAASATFALDINFVNQTSDKVNVNGALSLDGSNTTVLSITDLNPIGSFTFFSLPIADYGTWNGGLFTVGGVVIDDFDSTSNPNSAAFFVGPNRYKIDYNFNNTNTIALVSVPEPASFGLLAAGVALLGAQRRRRAACR